MLKRTLLLLLLLLSAPAAAQNAWPTPDQFGGAAPGAVMMCLNAQGQAIPATTAGTCIGSGGGGGGGGGAVTMAPGAVSTGAYQTGAFAVPVFLSGSYAAGSIGFGALAAGSYATGAVPAGGFADGALVTMGLMADVACATDTGTCTLTSLVKRLNQIADSPSAGLAATAYNTNTYSNGATSAFNTDLNGNLFVHLGNNGPVGATGAAIPASAFNMGATTGPTTGGLLTGLIQCDSKAVYDASTNGSTELVALSSGKTIYICGKTIFAGGTANVKLIYGTGTACATGSNNLTPAYPLIAQTGLVDPSPFYRGSKTAVSNALCINTSAGVAVQAEVYYTAF